MIGINDVGGSANDFDAYYAVISDQWRMVRWSLGYAKGKDASGKLFSGPFGGVEVMLGNTRLSALAEYDGQQGHASLRYYSPQIAWLGNSQMVGTAQRSLRAKDANGNRVDATSVALSLIVPFGQNARAAQHYKPSESQQLPELDECRSPTAVVASSGCQ